MWPIKCGTNFTQAEVDDFEASRFSFSSGLTKLPLVQCGLSLEELFPNVDIVPLLATIDIQSMHPVPICSPIISDGDKQPKHWNGKLFRFVALSSIDHILKMESSTYIDSIILKSMLVPKLGYEVVLP